jgi:UDP-N-acetylmuramoylalanine--D-glutamate ligase
MKQQSPARYKNKKILIMGYGLNRFGSGPAAARYLAGAGARLTVTDLRDAATLQPLMPLLDGFAVRWVLGRHEAADFTAADIVVKNPGVKRSSPYLAGVKEIATDISLFLEVNRNPLIAVSGSKGKSSVVTALHFALSRLTKCFLGGNITVSPLSFLSELTGREPVILELSSWQLGDLVLTARTEPAPQTALLTNLLPDHQNYYNNDMRAYAADKAQIFAGQQPDNTALLNNDDPWTPFFLNHVKSRRLFFGTLHNAAGREGLFTDGETLVLRLAEYNEQRLALPPSALLPVNVPPVLLALIADRKITLEAAAALLEGFTGPAHRSEFIGTVNGVSYYNDSAATIPEAVAASLSRFKAANVHLIAGGSDKELNFELWGEALRQVRHIYLLEGSAAGKITAVLHRHHISYSGPYATLEEAVGAAASRAKRGEIVLFSPGATSFGMFLNEFDRGNRFKALVGQL